MSDIFWKRMSTFAGMFTIGILFGVVVLSAHVEIKDLDIWLHLGMGKYIVENLTVPGVDILSYTVAGTMWVNHEWLFQVLVHWLFERWGSDGLIWMQVVVVFVTMVILLLLGYNSEKQLMTIFGLLLVLLVYQSRFTMRPDLFSLLFFVLYIYILSLHIDKRWSVYTLVAIQILWANIHGFFFFGPLFILIGLLAEWLKRHVRLPWDWNKTGRLTNAEYRRMKWSAFLVILASLVNPMTFHGAWYPISVFFQISGEAKIFFQYIQELQKPITGSDIFNFGRFPFYKILILVSLYSFIFNRRKIDVGVLLFWLIFLGFSLAALRNIVFFAIAAHLVIVTNALTISWQDVVPMRFTHKKFQHITSIAFKLLLMVWILSFGINRTMALYFDYDKFEFKSELEGISLRLYPTHAVDFLVEKKIQGNILNDFNSGAYLVGRCFPRIKVFIDGRTEVYGPQFFQVAQKIWQKNDVELLDKMIQDYEITIAFLPSLTGEIPKPLLSYFHNPKEWAAVYFDYDGVIFLKKVPQHEAVIQESAVDLAKWKGKPMDLYRLGARRVSAYQFINRAFTLETIGNEEGALAQAEEALTIDPAALDAYKILGKIYGRRQDYPKAFEYFRLAAVFDPGNRETQFNLAQVYYDLEQYAGAIKIYEQVLSGDPNNVRAQFLMARTLLKDKQFAQAVEAAHKAHQLTPDDVVNLLDLGDMFYQTNRFDEARRTYEMALETKKEEAKVRNKLGLAHKALGDFEKAKTEWKKALELDPHNKEIQKNLKRLKRK